MKKDLYRSLIIFSMVLWLGACNSNKASFYPVDAGGQKSYQVPGFHESQEEISDQEMKVFFSNYLRINESLILSLNQKPKELDPNYWEAYRTYQSKTNQILGPYLSDQAKEKLKKQYIQDDFHYPRFVEMSEYMVVGIQAVEEATIISKDSQNGNHLYEVMIRARAKVVDTKELGKKYTWDDALGYYSLKVEFEEIEEDEIKIRLKYLVETIKGEGLKVSSVREKTGIYLGLDEQTSPKNNSFISRVDYIDQVKEDHKEKVDRFLEAFMKEEYNFYNYYRKAYARGYEMVQAVLEVDLGLKNIVSLDEDYKDNFSPLMIPVKDDIERLVFSLEEDAKITPHISASKNNPAYQVKLNAQAVLVDGRVKTYEYIYLFTFDNDMISSVRFINQLER